jgi:hypothetical protein
VRVPILAHLRSWLASEDIPLTAEEQTGCARYLDAQPRSRFTAARLAEGSQRSSPDLPPVIFMRAWPSWGRFLLADPDRQEQGYSHLRATCSACVELKLFMGQPFC